MFLEFGWFCFSKLLINLSIVSLQVEKNLLSGKFTSTKLKTGWFSDFFDTLSLDCGAIKLWQPGLWHVTVSQTNKVVKIGSTLHVCNSKIQHSNYCSSEINVKPSSKTKEPFNCRMSTFTFHTLQSEGGFDCRAFTWNWDFSVWYSTSSTTEPTLFISSSELKLDLAVSH